MQKQDLQNWYKLNKAFTQNNDYKELSKQDWQELVSLNYEVMELARNIHNTNMLEAWK